MATAAQKKRATEVEERLKQKGVPGEAVNSLQVVVVAAEMEWKDLKAHLDLLDDSMLPSILQRLKLGVTTLLTEAKV